MTSSTYLTYLVDGHQQTVGRWGVFQPQALLQKLLVRMSGSRLHVTQVLLVVLGSCLLMEDEDSLAPAREARRSWLPVS